MTDSTPTRSELVAELREVAEDKAARSGESVEGVMEYRVADALEEAEQRLTLLNEIEGWANSPLGTNGPERLGMQRSKAWIRNLLAAPSERATDPEREEGS